MAKTKKTILSAILCFAMVLCLSVGAMFATPTKAFANTESSPVEVETFDQLKEALSGEGDSLSIVFKKDIVIPKDKITEECYYDWSNYDVAFKITNKNVSIDGNGHSLSMEVTGFDEWGYFNDNPIWANVFYVGEEKSSAGYLTLSNLTIRGGALSAIVVNDEKAQLKMFNSTIERTGSKETSGAGLANYGAKVYMENCKLSRNSAGNGGGFLNNGGWMIMNGCSLNENRSLSEGGGGGGGESKDGSALIMNNCTIANNTSTEIGGALNIYTASLALLNTTVVGNATTDGASSGGGIGLNGGKLYSANSLFANNYYIDIDGEGNLEKSDVGIYYDDGECDSFSTYYNAFITGKQLTGMTKFETDDKDFVKMVDTPSLVYDYGDMMLKPTNNLHRPALIENDFGTYSAYLGKDSTLVNNGCKTYFNVPDDMTTWSEETITCGYYDGESYQPLNFSRLDLNNWEWMDDKPFLAPTDEQYLVSTYQDGTERVQGVVGASGASDKEFYSLTVLPGNNGDVKVTGGSVYGDLYVAGTKVSVLAELPDGYLFSYWIDHLIDDTTYTNQYQFVNYELDKDIIISPIVEAQQPVSAIAGQGGLLNDGNTTFTVTTFDPEIDSITVKSIENNGISILNSSKEELKTLTPVANAGYQFVKWTYHLGTGNETDLVVSPQDGEITFGNQDTPISDTNKIVFTAVFEEEVVVVAQIGDTKYPTLEKAINAVENNGIIKLVENCAEDIVVKKSISFILDTNEKDFSGSITPASAGNLTTSTTGLQTNQTLYTISLHSHKELDIEFIGWDGGAEHNSLPTKAGNYVLIFDITLTSVWNVPEGTTNLCLNGHVINANGGAFSVITVNAGATLNLYDCDTTTVHNGYVDANGLWHLDATNEHSGLEDEKDIIGGIITGGTGFITAGNKTVGGGVYINGGEVTMNGGTITGNTATQYGGGVFIASGNFTMNGGAVANNKATSYGGGVSAFGGKFDMLKGDIIGNYGEAGGGVMINTGVTFTMADGTVAGNKAGNTGGAGVMLNVSSIMNMNGGTISGNITTGNGGGIYNLGVLTMTDGTITENSGVGGGVLNYGSYGTITLGGSAKITGNTGSNLYLMNTTITLGTREHCENCGDTGLCSVCGGDGKHRTCHGSGCPMCGGSGICTACGGAGTCKYCVLGNGVWTPTEDMSIGITLANDTGAFTIVGISADYSANFFSDNESYTVLFNAGTDADGDEYLELKECVAQIDETVYGSLADAIEAVEDDETIVLLADNEETITISEEITFSIDAGDFTNSAAISAGEGYKLSTEESGTVTTYKVEKLVAQIGDEKYTSLADAIEAVEDDETITLLADNEKEIEISKIITFSIDAGEFTNGATITAGDGYDVASSTEDTTTEYVVRKLVAIPTAEDGLVFNGETQTGVAPSEDDSYTLTGNTGTNADDYEATATLADTTKYLWEDESTDAKTIAWSIAKADNTISDLTIEDWVEDKTAKEPSATATDGTPVFTYSAEENGDYVATVPTTAGKYWVKASVAASDNYNEASEKLQFEIRKASLKPTGEEEQKVILDTEEGFSDDITVTVEVTVETEVESKINADKLTDYSKIEDENKLEDYERISVVFDVKLIRTVDGVPSEIQPSDIKPGTKINVKMLIPNNVDITKVTRILHVHNAGDITSFPFNPSEVIIEGGNKYYVIQIDRLSEIAFVYNATSEIDVLRSDYLMSVYETVIQLKGDGYAVAYDEESDDFGIKTLVEAINETAIRNAYVACLAKLDAHIDSVDAYRETAITTISEYAETMEVIVTADYLTFLETIRTTAKIDTAVDSIKAEIDDVVAKKAELYSALDDLDNAIDGVSDSVGSNATAIAAVKTVVDGITTILNDSTNGLAKINLNVAGVKTDVLAAINTLKGDLVTELGTQVGVLKAYVDTLEGKLNTKFTSVGTAITTAETNITTLINTETGNIDTAIETLSTKVGTVETNLTTAIGTLKTDLVNELGTQVGVLKAYIDTLEGKLNTKFGVVDTAIATAKSALTTLIDTETGDIDTAIATLNTKVGTVETNLTAAIATLKSDLATELGTQVGVLKAYIDTLEGKLNTKFGDTNTAIATAETAITDILNDSTNGLGAIQANVDAAETAITGAITTATNNLTQLINGKIAEINTEIETLSGTVQSDYDSITEKIAEVNALMQTTKSLVGTLSSETVDDLHELITNTENAVNSSYEALNEKLIANHQIVTNDMNVHFITVLVIVCVICALAIAITLLCILKNRNTDKIIYEKKDEESDN